ncbi:MAG TPA: D-hexose-6-phosphate mutarotase [Terriglobales bacterium]|nr:D-hexose-6-phosphate mutarotase [Terriglobales bacterium]
MAASITELESRFRIPGVAQVVPGQAGWPKVQVTGPAASGEIYLHGAHVTSWKPVGSEEVLYLSPNTIWQAGKAIRGGVPICFPWFGDKAGDPHAPAHGFVRAKDWQLDSVEQQGQAVIVTLSTESDDSTRQWFPGDFRTTYRVTFGAELVLELTTINTGSTALRVEEALHTYYAVGDATRAAVEGLDGARYIDKTDGFRQKQQQGDVMIAAETDRVYLNTEDALLLSDPVLPRRIKVAKRHSRTTVVWNPWSVKSVALKDLGDGEWKRMLCIEVSNVGDSAVEVAPGEQHTMRAETRVT